MRITRVKKIHDKRSLNPDEEISIDKLILRCLRENRECELCKIKNYLEEEYEMKFTQHHSVLRRLNNLIMKGLVGKHGPVKGRHTYYLPKKEIGSISMQADEFGLALRGLLNLDMPFAGSPRTSEKF